MPMPVMTTRRIEWLLRKCFCAGKQSYPKIFGFVDDDAVAEHLRIGDAHRELAHDDALHLHTVFNLLVSRQDLSREFYITDAQCAPMALAATPAEEEADQLPHRVQTQAARHDRVAFEMAGEEPQIRMDIQFRLHFALAVFATLVGDQVDPIEHQHRRQRQLRVAGPEHLALGAANQIVVFEGRLGHGIPDAKTRMVPQYALARSLRKITRRLGNWFGI